MCVLNKLCVCARDELTILDYSYNTFVYILCTGTHVAGTVAALDNEIGVVGVLNGSPLHNVRVFIDGSGSISNVVAGVNNCVDVGADVINMSLGSAGNRYVYCYIDSFVSLDNLCSSYNL